MTNLLKICPCLGYMRIRNRPDELQGRNRSSEGEWGRGIYLTLGVQWHLYGVIEVVLYALSCYIYILQYEVIFLVKI